jgi:hypothetical protein
MELDIPKSTAIDVSYLTNLNQPEDFISREEYEAIFEDKKENKPCADANYSVNEFKDNVTQVGFDSEVKLFKDLNDTDGCRLDTANISRYSTNIDKNSKFNKIILNDTLARKRKKDELTNKKATCKCLIF